MPKRAIQEMFNEHLEHIGAILTEAKVIGEPVYISDDEVLIPISKVTFGFGTGGAEYGKESVQKNEVTGLHEKSYPFGGAGVGGVSVLPEAFLYIEGGECSFIRMDKNVTIYERALELMIAVLKKTKRRK